jgi:hypothetical protein
MLKRTLYYFQLAYTISASKGLCCSTAFCQKGLHAVYMKMSIYTISGGDIDAKGMESFLCLHDKSMEVTIRRKK